MKRFRFSLETVLKVRRSREEKIQRDFSAIQALRAQALGELARLELELKQLNQQAEAQRKEGAGKVSLGSEAIFDAGRLAGREKIFRQRQRIAEIEIEMEAKRQELVAASRDRQVLEK